MKKSAGWGMGIAAVIAGAWLIWKLPSIGRSQAVAAGEASAIDALRRIHTAELDFRRNDGDGNGVPDFWTGDVTGLYRAAQPGGDPCAFLDPGIAAADKSPLPPGSGERPRLTAELPPKPWNGYWLRALKPFAVDGPDLDMNAWENLRGFAFVAFPVKAGESGKRVFLVREDGVVWAKDAEAAGPEGPADWPARGPEAEGWKKAE
ncbi:MAG: hypothetical protein FD180_1879 [Planctomycetota bacterium]|nr:MAG: hypothetical protein FD180_1879 [Planctomycetota bacterium]